MTAWVVEMSARAGPIHDEIRAARGCELDDLRGWIARCDDHLRVAPMERLFRHGILFAHGRRVPDSGSNCGLPAADDRCKFSSDRAGAPDRWPSDYRSGALEFRLKPALRTKRLSSWFVLDDSTGARERDDRVAALADHDRSMSSSSPPLA